MSSAQSLREFIRERLTAAAAEIFSEFEQTIVRYEEEIDRQRRLLEISWKPQINLHRIELPLHDVRKDEEVLTVQQLWNQERTSSLDQEQPEPLQEGPEPDRHQLLLSLFPEAEIRAAAPPGSTDVEQVVLVTEASKEQGDGVDQQDPEHLHIKDQMTADTDCGAETSKNPDLNPHEKTSGSSETEVSEDDKEADDVNECCELSDCVSETGDIDNDWNESRSSESDVKNVNKTFSCPGCGEQFFHKQSLQKHVQGTVHSANRSSGCLVNKKCFRLEKYVDSQRKVQKEQKFSCDHCGKCYSRISHLKVHLSVHTGQKPLSCELCGQRVKHKRNLARHMRVHTGQKPFACELCGQRFSQKSTLNKHMRVHTGQKPFACELCEQRFSQKSTLISHMRVHTGHKPFACELCVQRFSHKSTLSCHMRVHTGQKPFVCELCGHRFSDKRNLNRHTLVHTGQKPFACELCEQRFSQKSSLNSHMGVHPGQKPFACAFCGKKFINKISLNKHMRVHKGQTAFQTNPL